LKRTKGIFKGKAVHKRLKERLSKEPKSRRLLKNSRWTWEKDGGGVGSGLYIKE
jgi:hypothetical protein